MPLTVPMPKPMTTHCGVEKSPTNETGAEFKFVDGVALPPKVENDAMDAPMPHDDGAVDSGAMDTAIGTPSVSSGVSPSQALSLLPLPALEIPKQPVLSFPCPKFTFDPVLLSAASFDAAAAAALFSTRSSLFASLNRTPLIASSRFPNALTPTPALLTPSAPLLAIGAPNDSNTDGAAAMNAVADSAATPIPAPSLASLKKASVKIGGAQYRLVLPGPDFGAEKRVEDGFDALFSSSSSTTARCSTPISATGAPSLRFDAPFATRHSAARASAASPSFRGAAKPEMTAPTAKAELNAAEWSLPIDGWKLKKIETLMNSKTLRRAKRKSSSSSDWKDSSAAASNKIAAGTSNADANTPPEIFRSRFAAKKNSSDIVIVFPDSKDGKKELKFVMKTKLTKTTTTTAKTTIKAAKTPLHRLRKCGEGPSPPKMFSKAAVQRNVLYMKSADKLGYKKMKKMSSCPETGRCSACPLKNNQSLCHPDGHMAKTKEVVQ